MHTCADLVPEAILVLIVTSPEVISEQSYKASLVLEGTEQALDEKNNKSHQSFVAVPSPSDKHHPVMTQNTAFVDGNPKAFFQLSRGSTPTQERGEQQRSRGIKSV